MPSYLGADGWQDTVRPTGPACCPELFPSTCALICSFVQLLPEGPLWDVPKAEALARYQSSSDCADPEPSDLPCQSLVAYAIYVGKMLGYVIDNAIWPAVRESNPFTAVTTVDDWLDRLGWQDCFGTLCRSTLLGTLTPYEVMTDCGPARCDVPAAPDLACALKHGIIVALMRLQMAGVKTLDVINWIIEPLDSQLIPRNSVPAPGEDCDDVEFIIQPITKTLEACPAEAGSNRVTHDSLPAILYPNDGQPCGTQLLGLPQEIYPGTVAAECIVRSLLNGAQQKTLFRGCGAADLLPVIRLVAVMPDMSRVPFAVDTPTTEIIGVG